MATKICPKCKEDSFTWSIQEENSAFTNWGCYRCGYEAIGNEADGKLRKENKNKIKGSGSGILVVFPM